MDEAQEVPVDDEKEETELVGYYDSMTEEQRAALYKAREETMQRLLAAGKGVDLADERGDPELTMPTWERLKRANPGLLGYSIFDAEQTSKILRGEVEMDAEQISKMMGILPKERPTVHVAVLQSGYDSNEPAKVLGAYSKRPLAEARCYREIKDLGWHQPTDVIELIIDKDYDLEVEKESTE